MTEPLSTADLEASITRSLATIRKAWPALLNPPKPVGVTGGRPAPGSRLPAPTDPLSLRVEITTDLAFWVHALLDDKPDAIPTHVTIPTRNALATLTVLAANARWLSGWTHANRLACELADHAHDAATLAWPRNAGTILLGDCPNTIGVDGTPTVCGTPVRAVAADPGNVKCRGCGKTDTIDGWILAMVGDTKPVTAAQLVTILHKRMGVVVKEATIRKWKTRGELVAVDKDEHGRDLFDRHHAFVVVKRRDERVG